MTEVERPDMSGLPPAVVAYIEALEARLAASGSAAGSHAERAPAPLFEPNEPPTTLNVITVSANGLAKRTPRHLYARQRRGGMGIFDLDAPEGDQPAFVLVAEAAGELLLLTSQARAFRLPVSHVLEGPVRARGASIVAELGLSDSERLVAVLPAGRGVALALVSEKGYARVLPAHVAGAAMAPGSTLWRTVEFGPLAAACWTGGAGDLFVATRHGLAIRFPERALPLPGGLAIRLEAGDRPVAVEAVQPPEGESMFLLSADGRCTLRLMVGFAANKAPGGGGKMALKTDQLVAALAVGQADDLFILSRLSKIIRFRADELPATEGVVQGVAGMGLRADECVVATVSPAADHV